MAILNNIPLIGISLGIFLLFLIIPEKKGIFSNTRAKKLFITFLAINVLTEVDGLLALNGFESDTFSFLVYNLIHLVGLSFYLFIKELLDKDYNRNKWLLVVLLFTLGRFIATYYLFVTVDYQLEANENLELLLLWLDAYLYGFLNISFYIMAYNKLNNAQFSVTPSSSEEKNYSYLKKLLFVAIIGSIISMVYNIITDFNEIEWSLQIKIDYLIGNIVFFFAALYAAKIPLFAISGDIKDADNIKEKQRVIKKEDSENLWKEVCRILEEEKLFLNPKFRLNELAERCNSSVHQVSQAINENSGFGFSELINKYRIEEAKKLLISDKSEVYTILSLAYEVGFNSKSAFYTAFRKECGQTPTEFKKMYRKVSPDL